MRILLVSPARNDDLDNRIVRDVTYLGASALFAPCALATVAAHTPAGHEIVIHDEHVKGPVDSLFSSGAFDIVGVNCTTNQFHRALEIASLARARIQSVVTVAGGIGAPLLLHEREHSFDVVFHGEAEETWPEFIADVKRGAFKKTYQKYSRPDLTRSPVPRWDLLAADFPRYGTISVQTTRGCPHDCAFCDVIYTYGRQPRSKTVAQVLDEIRLIATLGARMVFIADDNFCGGNRVYAKELLRGLITLNASLDQPLVFMTQIDILVSRDTELLELLADSNFVDLMIGIESVNQDALRDMNKLQNLRVDPLEAVRTIQSYGIAVLGHMIVGNDSDGPEAFAQTEAFVSSANILHHFCHPLMAPPGTRLWYQLAREGRLVKADDTMADRLDIIPNIVPMRMSRVELLEGLADYWDRVFDPSHYLERAKRFIGGITRVPRSPRPRPKALGKVARMLLSVIGYYAFKAPRDHRKAFFSLLRIAGPRGSWLMPRIIFLYTCFLMDCKRARHDSKLAREQAALERANPDIMVAEKSTIPVAANVREHAPAILGVVYEKVRARTGSRNTLYRLVVDIVIEFSDRFGSSFGSLDPAQRGNLELICDRVVSSCDNRSEIPGELPADNPPAGFTREILDAVDSAVRVRAAV